MNGLLASILHRDSAKIGACDPAAATRSQSARPIAPDEPMMTALVMPFAAVGPPSVCRCSFGALASDGRMGSITRPDPTGLGQESVWDYPRPPRLEPCLRCLRVVLGGETIADTVSGWRVLETSHRPVYSLPVCDIVAGILVPAQGRSLCEWKGSAIYFDVFGGGISARRAAWSDPEPSVRSRVNQGRTAGDLPSTPSLEPRPR